MDTNIFMFFVRKSNILFLWSKLKEKHIHWVIVPEGCESGQGRVFLKPPQFFKLIFKKEINFFNLNKWENIFKNAFYLINAFLSASPGNCTHLLNVQLTRSCEELLEFFFRKKSRCLTEPWRWPTLTRSSCPTFRTSLRTMSGRSLLSLLAFLWLLDSSLAATAATITTREDIANQDQPTKT